MTARPLLAGTAAGSALLLVALSGAPALAAPAEGAVGTATSTATLLRVAAGGHDLAAGTVRLVSDTASGSPVAKATITPLLLDGTPYGRREVTPANSPLAVAPASSPAALAGIVSAATPAISASATSTPSTSAGTSSLGSVSLLGLEVPLSGGSSLGSSVTPAGATGQKTVSISDLSLPSIAALLAALGLDLSALPAGTLTTLVDQLGIATDAVDAAQGAVTQAQSAVTGAAAALATAQSDLVAKTGANSTAQAAAAAASGAFEDLLEQVSTAVLATYPEAGTITGYTALSELGRAAVEADVPGTAAAFATHTDASAAAAAAAAAVVTAQAAVDAAQAALAVATDALREALAAVDALAAPILSATPLLSLDSLTVGTRAASTSATLAGQRAEVTGGAIKGLRVLGTDVLQTALGTQQLELLELAGAKADGVTQVIEDVTGVLSSVLSSVPGLPALRVPAPEVEVLARTTKTSVAGGYGRAMAGLDALRVTLPAITVPDSVALPGAAELPALDGVPQVVGQLSSAPLSIGVLSLVDQTAFKPALTPGKPVIVRSARPLADTGAPAGLAAAAAVTLLGALALRRRRAVPDAP